MGKSEVIVDEISFEITECSCGSSKYVINTKDSTITCIKCFKSVLFREPIKKKKRVVISNTTNLRKRWDAISSRAKHKGFGICKYEDFMLWWIITPDICYYCGGEMANFHSKGKVITIDRKNNGIGYVIENMVKACYVCNDTKGHYFTEEQMHKMAKSICRGVQ